MNNIVNNTTTANVINTSDIATNRNIVLCGVGGQGTVLASKLLAAAAMSKDIPVMSAETIGMAQRGGSVFSHLRMGKNLYSPMIKTGTADLIIGFEPGETVRMLPYLKEHGQVVVSTHAIQTSYRNTKRLFLRRASDDRLSEETCGKSDSYRCRYYLPGNRFSESIEHGTFRCSYPHRSFRFFP